MRPFSRTFVVAAALVASRAAAQPPRAEYYSAASLQRTADSLRTAKSISKVLGDRGAYQYVLVTRDATGSPEQHAKWTDVMLVQAGSATVLLGGHPFRTYTVPRPPAGAAG